MGREHTCFMGLEHPRPVRPEHPSSMGPQYPSSAGLDLPRFMGTEYLSIMGPEHPSSTGLEHHKARASQLSEARASQLHGAIACVCFSAGCIYPQCPLTGSRREGQGDLAVSPGSAPPLPEHKSAQGQREHTPLSTHHLRPWHRETCGAQICFSNPQRGQIDCTELGRPMPLLPPSPSSPQGSPVAHSQSGAHRRVKSPSPRSRKKRLRVLATSSTWCSPSFRRTRRASRCSASRRLVVLEFCPLLR